MARFQDAIRLADLLDREVYGAERPARLRRMSAAKKPRRVLLAPHATVLFENRETVLGHIQEIVHVERVHTPDRIQSLIEEHARLVPRGFELTATLLLDGASSEACKSVGRELARGHAVLWLRLGSRLVPAESLETGTSMDPDGPVHYVRFVVGASAVQTLRAHETDVGLLLRSQGHAVFSALSADLRDRLAGELVLGSVRLPVAFEEPRPNAI